ncbi:MAG TPA: hypothetical protein VM223_09020, partial [Planctomycetota bacterium]|nr:hypothetical protein [Planctomycetota bacterium]
MLILSFACLLSVPADGDVIRVQWLTSATDQLAATARAAFHITTRVMISARGDVAVVASVVVNTAIPGDTGQCSAILELDDAVGRAGVDLEHFAVAIVTLCH